MRHLVEEGQKYRKKLKLLIKSGLKVVVDPVEGSTTTPLGKTLTKLKLAGLKLR
jgi:phosphomannomutase